MAGKGAQRVKGRVRTHEPRAHVKSLRQKGTPIHGFNRLCYMEDGQGHQQGGPDTFIRGHRGNSRHGFGSGGNGARDKAQELKLCFYISRFVKATSWERNPGLLIVLKNLLSCRWWLFCPIHGQARMGLQGDRG